MAQKSKSDRYYKRLSLEGKIVKLEGVAVAGYERLRHRTDGKMVGIGCGDETRDETPCQSPLSLFLVQN